VERVDSSLGGENWRRGSVCGVGAEPSPSAQAGQSLRSNQFVRPVQAIRLTFVYRDLTLPRVPDLRHRPMADASRVPIAAPGRLGRRMAMAGEYRFSKRRTILSEATSNGTSISQVSRSCGGVEIGRHVAAGGSARGIA